MTYVQIPIETIQSPGLNLIELGVLVHCLAAQDEKHLTEKHIAASTGYDAETIGNCLENLERMGYINPIHRHGRRIGTAVSRVPVKREELDRVAEESVAGSGTYLGLVK